MNKNVITKMYAGSDKVELSEVSVELALVDDLKKISDVALKSIDSFLSAYKIIDAQKTKAIADGESYYKNAAQIEKSLQEFEVKAKELGINANDNKDYKSAKDLLVRYDIQAVFDRVDSLRKLK